MSRHRIAVIGTGHKASGEPAAPPEIAAIAGADCLPELRNLRLGAFPATPYDRSLAVVAHIDAGIAAAGQGAAAVFLNTFGDYGIVELRSALGVPVVGAGEAAMLVAATLGRRFAIVTIWPRSLGFIYDERLASCAMQSRCVRVRHVLDDGEMALGLPDDPVEKMRAGQPALIERIVAASNAAVRDDGADTIVLGCTCMAPIAALVAEQLAVPVVDPMTTGYLYAESLVRLRLVHSSVAYPRAQPARLGAIPSLVDGTLGASPAGGDEECPVCIVTSTGAGQ